MSTDHHVDTRREPFLDGHAVAFRLECTLETNPLDPDTDDDNLPDGWEMQYAFDPFDDGIVGHTNLRTGLEYPCL